MEKCRNITRYYRTREGRSPERRPCAKKWETQKRKWVMTEEKGGEKQEKSRRKAKEETSKEGKETGYKVFSETRSKERILLFVDQGKNRRKCPCSVHYYCSKEKKKEKKIPDTDIIIIIWSNIISRVIERSPSLVLSNRTR